MKIYCIGGGSRILHKEFLQIKASGCGHEVFNPQKLLNNILKPADARRKCLPLEDTRNLSNEEPRSKREAAHRRGMNYNGIPIKLCENIKELNSFIEQRMFCSALR